jgi:hypothetical protein
VPRPLRTGFALAAVLAAALTGAGCRGADEPAATASGGRAPAPGGRPSDWFTDRAAESGLEFAHVNGASGAFYYPEILGPGVALFDYDNDGDLDAFLAQGRPLGPEAQARRSLPSGSGGRLFRNDILPGPPGAIGAGTLRFTDVTPDSGIAADQYGLGVATGDIDNDGWVDLLLTNFGTNQLWRNNGNGTFADVSAASGIEDRSGRFAVSAAFLDYDRDGWLDLYVANNVRYAVTNPTKCPNMAGAPDYCPPQIYGGQPDRLYRNRRNRTFEEVTATALVGGQFGPALGVATADYDNDGWIDILVANDGEENLLWLNQRNGTFKESALVSGVAVTADGKAEASMGVDAGDFDNDGDEDLFLTELTGEGSNLYVNDGAGRFQDLSAASGLGPGSLPYTGWGTAWIDFDNDGWLDILSVNGTIVANESREPAAFPYGQPKLLFRNLRNGRFENVTAQAGSVFRVVESGRGAAFGDVDNDGDIDVLVGHDAGPVRLLVNDVGSRQHWLGLRLVGRPAGPSSPAGSAAGGGERDMLGARVIVRRPDGSALWRRARSDGSYGSANDPRVLVGLGDRPEIAGVEVRWPGGRVERWTDVPVDRWTVLREGSGT